MKVYMIKVVIFVVIYVWADGEEVKDKDVERRSEYFEWLMNALEDREACVVWVKVSCGVRVIAIGMVKREKDMKALLKMKCGKA